MGSSLPRVLLLALLALPACSKEEPPPPPGELSLEELVGACIASTGCGVRPYPRVANCLEAYYTLHRPFGLGPIYNAIYRCVIGARGDCDAVFACYGTHQAAGRCDTSFAARCEGSRAFSCDTLSGRVFVYDCALAELSCLVGASQSFDAKCSVGICDMASGSRKCEGNRLLSCADGIVEVVDCASLGQRCGDASGGAACVGSTDEECQAGKFSPRCEGSVAVSCVGGRVQKTDCSGQPLAGRCEAGACAPAGGACRDEFDRCAGGTLEICIDGSWRSHDCSALGLGPCKTLTNGAACAPGG
jgi:hypothetical protein